MCNYWTFLGCFLAFYNRLAHQMQQESVCFNSCLYGSVLVEIQGYALIYSYMMLSFETAP